MCENILENIYRILVYIRLDIYQYENANLVKTLLKGIDEDKDNKEIVKILIIIKPQLEPQLMSYNGKEYVMSQEIREFIIKTLEYIYESLVIKEYEMAYDMVDMLHLFPEMVFKTDKKHKKKYWKVYVKPVLKKWDINTIKKIY